MTESVPSVSLALAFVAGLASFLSPCVAPLVPGYLGYLAGETTGGRPAGFRIVGVSLLFVLGFTFVFVALGASAGLLGGFLDEFRRPLNRVAGVVMVLMGLLILGLGPRLLQRDTRFHFSRDTFGPASPVVLGMAFAFGWTPCIGPILASILFYAGFSETAGEAAFLLAAYSLGLGVPFVLVGVAFSKAMSSWKTINRLSGPLNVVSGLMLVAIGVLFLSDRFYYINIAAQRFTQLLPFTVG